VFVAVCHDAAMRLLDLDVHLLQMYFNQQHMDALFCNIVDKKSKTVKRD